MQDGSLTRNFFAMLYVCSGRDLFASMINAPFPRYISFRLDPNAEAVDAFSLSWKGLYFYAFPSFCVIPSLLPKIRRDKVRGIIVVPDWPSQPWFPAVAKVLVNTPVLLSARQNMSSASKQRRNTQASQKTQTDYLRGVRCYIRSSGL